MSAHARPSHDGRVDVAVRFVATEPPEGYVRVFDLVGGMPEAAPCGGSFVGWLGLLAVLEEAVASAGRPSARGHGRELDARREAELGEDV
jgi:hypothetical protein